MFCIQRGSHGLPPLTGLKKYEAKKQENMKVKMEIPKLSYNKYPMKIIPENTEMSIFSLRRRNATCTLPLRVFAPWLSKDVRPLHHDDHYDDHNHELNLIFTMITIVLQ